MTREQHLLGESIQEITLYAWPIIWNDNKYDQDSRVVLETIREWAEEFEKWWMAHSENWMDEHDYIEEAEAFAKRKCDAYVKQFEQPDAESPVRGSIEERIEAIQDLMEICHADMTDQDREWAFTTIRGWAAEFTKHWYNEMTDEEREKAGGYLDAIRRFAEAKLKKIHQRDYIVTLHRAETIEVKVLVSADDWKEAVDKVKTAWREDESFSRKVLDFAEEGEVEFTAHESLGDDEVDLSL